VDLKCNYDQSIECIVAWIVVNAWICSYLIHPFVIAQQSADLRKVYTCVLSAVVNWTMAVFKAFVIVKV